MDKKSSKQPRLVVFSTLFPNPGQPNAGVFIRERMFRVGKHVPIIVVAPVAWFPGQSIIRYFKPHFRPDTPFKEVQEGVTVYHPRFFSIPFFFKCLDGYFLALSSFKIMKKLKKEFNYNIIDSHFAYPDGFAATRLGKWLSVPVTITLRGTEVPHSKSISKRPLLLMALKSAKKVFSVSTSLKNHVVKLGAQEEKITVVGNGVDIEKFYPVNGNELRNKLGIKETDKILITIGALVERKGFHRIIEIMPDLMRTSPELHYLVVGGAGVEGDWSEKLKSQVYDFQLQNNVHFLGAMLPAELKKVLSAADIFVLSTRNEGWANVILEAMACGLPVIATDVGGNSEVISNQDIGKVIPFDEPIALKNAINEALEKKWNRQIIIQYAKDNSWTKRVKLLIAEFEKLI